MGFRFFESKKMHVALFAVFARFLPGGLTTDGCVNNIVPYLKCKPDCFTVRFERVERHRGCAAENSTASDRFTEESSGLFSVQEFQVFDSRDGIRRIHVLCLTKYYTKVSSHSGYPSENIDIPRSAKPFESH